MLIWFWDGFFYVYLLEEISDFVWNNLRMVGNFRVQLVEVSLEEMKHLCYNFCMAIISDDMGIDVEVTKIKRKMK